jgi:carbon monoxide dehydrogenase subunit G
MKIAGNYILHGPREKVWPLIYDPASLVSLIPGCEKLEQVSPDEYRGQMQLRFPAVSGVYHTYVKILERREPAYSRFEGEVDGPAGRIQGTASFELAETENSQTSLSYTGQAMITGSLAKLSPRFIEGIAQTLLKQGLAQLDQQLQAQTSATLPATNDEDRPASFWTRFISKLKIFLR